MILNLNYKNMKDEIKRSALDEIKEIHLTAENVKEHSKLIGEAVDEALVKLNGLKDTQLKTNGKCFYRQDKQGSYVDFQTSTNPFEIACMIGYIKQKETEYQTGLQILGATEAPVFKWNGFPSEDWLHDAKVRLDVLTYNNRKEILEKTRETIEKFMSEEERQAREFKNIINALTGM